MWTLIGLIALGIISATLSYYNRNYYVGVFNDILGKEDDEKPATRVGRGFLYGFFFPLYLSLIVAGIVALIAFLIVAGIIAAIVFVLVWVTENILPREWFGDLLIKLYRKMGMAEPAPSPAPLQPADFPVPPRPPAPPASSYVPPAADTIAANVEEPKENTEELGINVTRKHKLD
jgi:hypothetical protein